MWRRLSGLPPAVFVAAPVILVLAGLLLWSRAGQVTTARVEVRGSTISAYIDGRLAQQATLEAPASGGIFLNLTDQNSVPSLPKPRGVESVRVTDTSGAVLFEDGFATPPGASGKWTVVAGKPVTASGMVASNRGEAKILHLAPEWRDYDVEVRARNLTNISMGVRAESIDSAVIFTANPFRHIDTYLGVIRPGKPGQGASKSPIDFSEAGSARSLAAMFLGPLPLIGLGLGIVTAAGVAVARAFQPRQPAGIPAALPLALAIVLSLAAYAVSLDLIVRVAGAVPHVPDELSYMFQARVFAGGHITASPPPSEAAFEWSDPSPIAVHDGKWASIYPFGHPLALGLGFLVHAPWLIPPLLGGLSVLLVFLLARKLYRPETAVLAATLFAVSPFFLMTASNFMSHTTTAFYLLASLVFLAYADRRPLAYSFLAGIFIGLVFNTRPLTGAALVPAFGLFTVASLLGPLPRREAFRRAISFGLGCAVMLALYFVYRYLTTGDPFTLETLQAGGNSLGFSGNHTFAAGLSNEQTQAAYLMLVLHNWPVQLGAALALLPFLLGTTRRWDWFMAACALSVMAVYAAYFYNGLMHGPRFWFEAAPLLMLLSARGVELAAERAGALSAALWRRAPATGSLVAGGALYLAVGLMALFGSYDWLLGNGAGWTSDFVPGESADLERFNGIDKSMVDVVQDADLPNGSLVFVDDCSNWQCYGSLFWLNSPQLDGDTVYARLVNDERELSKVLAAYPDRFVYQANYMKRTVKPYQVDGSPDAAALRARDIPVVTPPPPPDDSAGAPARDAQRRADLQQIALLLERYRAQFGSYPSAPNPQSLCVYAADAGCALEKVGPIPRDPRPGWNYAYWSTGPAEYLLISRLEASPESCAVSIPAQSRPREPILCIVQQTLP